jgi:hypothetical protein
MLIRSIFLFLLFPTFSYSQQVESLHSVKLGLGNLNYSYEHVLQKQFSINLEAGINWGFHSSNQNFELFARPFLKVEPRLYYNVKKRYDRGKFLNNSASFFSLNAGYNFGTFNSDISSSYFILAPMWGFRRAMGKHFIFEAQIGGGLWFNRTSSQFNPALNVTFGYVF